MKFFRSKTGIILSLLAVAGIGFYFWSAASSGGIDIQANTEGTNVIGEPFDFKVNFSNNSNNILNDLKLTLEVPENIIIIDGEGKKIVQRVAGNIDIGAVHQETFKVMATPSGDSSRKFTVSLSYVPGTIAAHFEKSKTFDIPIEPLETDLSLNVPEKVFSGEEFDIKADYKAKKPENSPKLSFRIIYPENFTKTSEELKETDPTSGTFRAKGKVNFPDDASFEVEAQLIVNLMGKDYMVAEHVSKVLISPSPLSLKININGSTDFIAHPGDTLNYNLIYKNNTQVALQDVLIKIKLSGEMLDFSSVDSRNAKFNLSAKTITWDSSQFNELTLLNAGDEKSVGFSIKLRSGYLIKKLNDKNFSVKAEANIESPTVPFLVSADKTINSASLVTKVGGQIQVEAKALFRDAISGILNKGPWPPRVGTGTQYTIHWLLTNYASDVREIEVRAALEDGVVFTGVIKSNTTTPPEVDEESGQIIWKIDRLVATTGITGEKPEAIFQVEATPTPEKRGNYMPLLSATEVKAMDEFANATISGIDTGLDTRLVDDPTVSEGQGLIVQ